MLRISRGPRKVWFDSTTPRGSPSVCGASPGELGTGPISSGGSPWPAMCTMRQSRSSSALTTVRASAPKSSSSSGLISAFTRSAPSASGAFRRCATAFASARAPGRRGYGGVALRLADHEHARVRVRRRRPARETASCAACAAASRGSPTAACRRRRVPARRAVSHGMPAVPLSSSISISVVPPRNGSISTGTSNWNSVRPICASSAAVVRCARDQLAQQAALRGLRAHLGARTFGVERVVDRGVAVRPGVASPR